MPTIHPTAVVESAAEIADGAWIGPYCIIGPDAKIGAACRLEAHVNIAGRTEIGARADISAFASLGGRPQSVHYRGGPTRLVIGDDCQIRESVTISRGTEDGGGLTTIGDRCFFMVSSHVGHDCRVGDGVIMANGALLGGHCVVGENVFMGGLSAAHQHTRIGANAMISGLCGLRADVIPFGFTIGAVGRLAGLNLVGMKRRKFSRASIHAARRAYHTLFEGTAPFSERVDAAEAEGGDDPAVAEIIAFIRTDAQRALLQPAEYRDA